MTHTIATVRAAYRQYAADIKCDLDRLLVHVLQQPASVLYAYSERIIDDVAHAQFDALCARRLGGEPLAYLLGSCEFAGLTLVVSKDTLIPRADSELLVSTAAEHIQQSSQHIRQILDLGTGSGALACALAALFPAIQLMATDISPAAARIAATNSRRLQLANIAICVGSWYEALHGCFDIIVANPPYLDYTDSDIAASVRAYEPAVALFATDSGLAALRHVVNGAATRLVTNGMLAVEHGWRQGAAVRQMMHHAQFAAITTKHDSNGHERVTAGYFVGN